MNTAVQPFDFKGHRVRVVPGEDGEPLFVLADLCKVLSIANARDVAARLADDMKGVGQIDTLGGAQQMTVVTEAGMYAVVMRSDKPQSEPFRRWVTSEVLPSIRKTGGYGKAPARELTFEEKALEVMSELTARVEDQRKQLEIVKPLAARAVAYSASARDIGRQEFAREICKALREQLGIDAKQPQVYEFLGRKLNLFIVGNRRDNGHATSHGERGGWSLTHKGTTEDGHNYATGKLTRKGQEYAWQRIFNYADEHGTLTLPIKETSAA